MPKPKRRSIRERIAGVLRLVFDPQFLPEMKRLADDAERGEDILETAHGHYCNTKCWHYQMGSEETRADIRARAARRTT